MAHSYSNTASEAQLNASMDASTTTLTVSAPTYTGWPAASFWAMIARGTASAELVEVTNVAGTTLTVVRGQGGTVAAPHGAGDKVEHVAPASVFAAVETHTEASTSVHGVSGSIVGTTGNQTVQDKTYRGAFRSDFSDAQPTGVAASFTSNADNANARDGFVHNNTAGDADKRGFLLAQSGTPRFQAHNDGTVDITPNASATRSALTIDNGTGDKAISVEESNVERGFWRADGHLELAAPEASATAARLTIRTAAGTRALEVKNSAGTDVALMDSSGGLVVPTLQVNGGTTLLSGASVSGTTAVANLTVSGTSSHAGAASFTTAPTAYGGSIPMPTVVSSLASVTSPATGQLATLSTENMTYRYNGSAWKRAYPLGGATASTRTHGEYIRTSAGSWTGDQLAGFNSVAVGSDAIAVSGTGNTDFLLQIPGKWRIETGLRAGGATTLEVSIYEGTSAFALSSVIAQSQGNPCTSTSRTKYYSSATTIRINWFASGGTASLDSGGGGTMIFLTITYLGQEE